MTETTHRGSAVPDDVQIVDEALAELTLRAAQDLAAGWSRTLWRDVARRAVDTGDLAELLTLGGREALEALTERSAGLDACSPALRPGVAAHLMARPHDLAALLSGAWHLVPSDVSRELRPLLALSMEQVLTAGADPAHAVARPYLLALCRQDPTPEQLTRAVDTLDGAGIWGYDALARHPRMPPAALQTLLGLVLGDPASHAHHPWVDTLSRNPALTVEARVALVRAVPQTIASIHLDAAVLAALVEDAWASTQTLPLAVVQNGGLTEDLARGMLDGAGLGERAWTIDLTLPAATVILSRRQTPAWLPALLELAERVPHQNDAASLRRSAAARGLT